MELSDVVQTARPDGAAVTADDGATRATARSGRHPRARQAQRRCIATTACRLATERDRHALARSTCLRDPWRRTLAPQWWTRRSLHARWRISSSQAFCSAPPVSDTDIAAPHWSASARPVGEAASEATLLVRLINARQFGSNVIYPTELGARDVNSENLRDARSPVGRRPVQGLRRPDRGRHTARSRAPPAESRGTVRPPFRRDKRDRGRHAR